MVSVQDLVLLMQASPVQVMEKAVLVGNSLEEEPLELRTTLCALAGSPSLEARVTSMKSAVHFATKSILRQNSVNHTKSQQNGFCVKTA